MENVDLNQLTQQIVEIVSAYGLSILAALGILILGRIAANLMASSTRKAMHRANVDENLIGFLAGLVRYSILAATVVAVLSKLGMQTTQFVAVIGAAGLAVGLALQGSLANFASGVLLLFFRPFKKGDFVEAGGTSGSVQEVSVFNTILHTPDNKKVIIPNAQVTGGTITNYSATGTRRVDLVAGIGYGDDIEKARAVLHRIVGISPEPSRPSSIVRESRSPSRSATCISFRRARRVEPDYSARGRAQRPAQPDLAP